MTQQDDALLMFHSYLPTFVIYFLAVAALCFIAYRYAGNLSDYILGGRSLSAPIAALGVGASDMSSWLLMALPGAAYVYGMNQIWIAIGLCLGAYFNWIFVAKRLRIYTEMCNDSLTIPSFFDERIHDPKSIIRIVTAAVVLLFFTIYAAAGFKGGALVFGDTFHLTPHVALVSSALFIVLYTTIGGFLAISWVDFFQGCLLFVAIIGVPVAIFLNLHGVQHHQFVASLSGHWLPAGAHTSTAIMIASFLAWGLGYFGQPHILVRFMALKDPSAMPTSRRIHISWMLVALLGAISVGLLGHYALPETLSNPESVLIALAKHALPDWLAGLLFAIILSAIMSAISAQLLAAASAVTADLYARFKSSPSCSKHLLQVSRLTVLMLGIIALYIAADPNVNILKLASYAWAGLGASFGPCVLLALYWRKLSAKGAIAGIVSAAITVIVWKYLGDNIGGVFKLYEILPAFIVNFLIAIPCSLAMPDNDETVVSKFDAMRELIRKN